MNSLHLFSSSDFHHCGALLYSVTNLRFPMSTSDPSTPDDLDGEPTSLAEEIAAEVKAHDDISDRYESLKKGYTHISE